jgi:hypothetical protein
VEQLQQEAKASRRAPTNLNHHVRSALDCIHSFLSLATSLFFFYLLDPSWEQTNAMLHCFQLASLAPSPSAQLAQNGQRQGIVFCPFATSTDTHVCLKNISVKLFSKYLKACHWKYYYAYLP